MAAFSLKQQVAIRDSTGSGLYVIVGRYKMTAGRNRWESKKYQPDPKGSWYGLYPGTLDEYLANYTLARMKGTEDKIAREPRTYQTASKLLTLEQYQEIKKAEAERQARNAQERIEKQKRISQHMRILAERVRTSSDPEHELAKYLDNWFYEIHESARLTLDKRRKTQKEA